MIPFEKGQGMTSEFASQNLRMQCTGARSILSSVVFHFSSTSITVRSTTYFKLQVQGTWYLDLVPVRTWNLEPWNGTKAIVMRRVRIHIFDSLT
jgi:hypothetical protein